MHQREQSIQIEVCKWLKLAYPKVIFTCDLASGMKLSIGQAVRAKKMRSSRGLPDLMIFEPKANFHGMFVEIKKEGTPIIKRNGELVADEHIQEQYEMLDKLQRKGYYAIFGIGLEETIKKIDIYLR